MVDNSAWVGFTTFLTFYALTGDDIRIIATDKPTDMIFNINTIVCVVVFFLEVILNLLGKNDYLGSFFFYLDVASTFTLVFDLTWVSEWIQGGSGGGEQMRSGRTARVGARLGRVVRVLRLVRIIKIYKSYYEVRQRRERKKLAEEEDDWDEADYEAVENAENKESESRVGKKLSEMTTRRVICLILINLLALQYLAVDSDLLLPSSWKYGSTNVANALQARVANNNTETSESYGLAMLNYLYYHNWYVCNQPDKYCPNEQCAGRFLGCVFRVGIRGVDSHETEKFAPIDRALINKFDNTYGAQANSEAMMTYGLMPSEMQEAFASKWDIVCENDGPGFSFLSKQIGDPTYQVDCLSDLRGSEVQAFSAELKSGGGGSQLLFYFDVRPYNRSSSVYSVIQTYFIMVLLIASSLLFSSDANRLVLQPVEKMIARVEAIRDRPLLAMKMADEEFKVEEIKKAKNVRSRKTQLGRIWSDLQNCCSPSDREVMETIVLEKTIIKLGSLLALGFGEAGADIIGKNMSGSDSAGVDAMVPGRKVECIIGTLRVRDFSIATEVLQSKVMMFSNQIAEIVHGICSEYHGAPNKNTGEQFLVIWKEDESGNVSFQQYAECSIVAAATIIGGVHNSPLLGSYREHPGLQNRLGSNCRVHLSCGLHKGWAIEGAVGSEFKIDCSYLSPNVSIANSVERSTEIYGVSMIVAQSVVDYVSPQMKQKCRLIDKVVIRGQSAPMQIFCLDLNYMALDIDRRQRPKVNWNTRQRFKVRQWMDQEKTALIRKDLVDIFDEDTVILAMRASFTVEFFQLFNMGYQNYSLGEWKVAKRLLSLTKHHDKNMEDGPSEALLRFMEVPHGFEAPKGWQGVRELAC